MAEAPKERETVFKICIIGNSGVGKSNLLYRFADDEFVASFMPTIGVDFVSLHRKFPLRRCCSALAIVLGAFC